MKKFILSSLLYLLCSTCLAQEICFTQGLYMKYETETHSVEIFSDKWGSYTAALYKKIPFDRGVTETIVKGPFFYDSSTSHTDRIAMDLLDYPRPKIIDTSLGFETHIRPEHMRRVEVLPLEQGGWRVGFFPDELGFDFEKIFGKSDRHQLDEAITQYLDR